MSSRQSSVLDDLVGRVSASPAKTAHPETRYNQPFLDLLPLLIDSWRRIESSPHRHDPRRRPNSPRLWLEQQQRCGAQLTVGVPGNGQNAQESWLGKRLAWWPCGVPRGRRVGVVSSRLGRDLDAHKYWFAALRALCASLDPHSDWLLSVTSTTTARFLNRCTSLFGMRLLLVQIADQQIPILDDWLNEVQRCNIVDQNASVQRCSLSPAIDDTASQSPLSEALSAIPLRDRAVVALSDRLYALHVRQRGHYERLLQLRLADPAFPPASVYLALHPQLVDEALGRQLQSLGAIGWVTVDQPESTPVAPETRTLHAPVPAGWAVVPLPHSDNWIYLSHCTRQQNGPWPDQSTDHYLDELILGSSDTDHSALASLSRILRQRRLIAGSRTIRGGFAVVSFTRVPLRQLHHLHAFRSHLGRWDFEPYGISIEKEWLERRGARPVQYGDQACWDRLGELDRPFFQLVAASKPGRPAIQWSREQEWRHLGDIDLDPLPEHAALVFVPSTKDAEQLAGISPWPVAIVPYSDSPS